MNNLQDEEITYLEMLHSSDLIASDKNSDRLQIKELTGHDAETARHLYKHVGKEWLWIDRLKWSLDEWKNHLDSSNVRLWLSYTDNDISGYFELNRQNDDTEIAYFGLMPEFIGMGLGARLLTSAIEQAWNTGAKRVWVHTSSRDHPFALANYQARGFRIYKAEVVQTPTNAG